jgi:O-glycosyl hydrolase
MSNSTNGRIGVLVLLLMFGAFSVPCTQPKSQVADATPDITVDVSALSTIDGFVDFSLHYT